VGLDWSTAIITGAAEEPLGLGILGQQRSGGLVGGVGVVGLVCRQENPFSHSFEMDWSSAAQTQESRQHQHDMQKVGAGCDSVKRMIPTALVLSSLRR
jgi:hypothetical protein